jgi:hypothetical protein
MDGRIMTRAVLAFAAGLALLAGPAAAHDHWINGGHYVSPIDGSHCCGEADCVPVDPDYVFEASGGFALHGPVTYGSGEGALTQLLDETVPAAEVQASRDGQYWRCRKPDGSRRCFFAPPPST